MILLKKMRDGSLTKIEVDEKQAEFLLKHDKNRYSITEDVEPEEIPEFIDEE